MQSVDKFLDFLLFEKGEDVQIDGVPCKALLTDAAKGADFYIGDQFIRAKHPLHAGAVVSYKGESWLAISEADESANSRQCRIRKSNHITKFILNDWLYAFVSFLEMMNLTVSRSGGINMATGTLQVRLPANEMTSKISVNTRFIASFSPWKVIGVDVTQTGLVILEAQKDAVQPGDDIENEIAGAVPVWTISLSANEVTLEPEATAAITAVLNRDGAAQENEELIWHSSDPAVVTVSDGQITAMAEGTAQVIVCWAKHPTICATIAVTVKTAPVQVVTYVFYSTSENGSGKSYTDFDVRQGFTKVYGIEKQINGTIAELNDTYTFSFNPNGATSTYYTYSVADAYSVKIKCNRLYTQPVTLTGTSNETGESISVSFKLKSAF